MNREIKFKVWDNWNKKFLNYGEVDIWDLIFGEPKLIEEIYIDGMANECLEFLQYTGFKDVNGVEICEGDILKKHFEYEDEIETINDIRNLPSYDLSKSEVIGNIYENKELLKELKKL